MGQVSPCLKSLFIFFNVLFAIVGGVFFLLAILSQVVVSHENTQFQSYTTGVIVLYVIGGVTVALAVLGAYGAHKEKRIPLIVFMSILLGGGLILMRFAIPSAMMRSQLNGSMEKAFREMLPLDEASENTIALTNKIQFSLQCCGWFSYEDWRGKVPESCSCQTVAEEEEGLCQSISYKALFRINSKMIYNKPCFPIILKYTAMLLDIGLGVMFGFSALALLGALVSGILLHQMRVSSPRSTLIFNVPTFSAQPPKYTELFNSAEK
ncbi:tetraspanin-8-like [Osmerus eperlanus]|uniref:tetraspanin-8-like n=1 Tax=Osmerus eperlanus TaxID=29151 RepID=UPI002E13B112